MNKYVSICCNAQASKGALVAPRDKPKQASDYMGLGTWQCNNCHKKCKVSVRKDKDAD